MVSSNSFKIGCGQCFISDHALEEIGPELKFYGNRIFILSGERAFNVSGERIIRSIGNEGLHHKIHIFKGECSRKNIMSIQKSAHDYNAGIILAVGGGKCIDAGKVVACNLRIPVATVPTIAATCAPFVPGSVVYTEEGKPDGGFSNKHENICIFMDTNVLRDAPVRYLAAGMADALAKYYELFLAGTVAADKLDSGENYNCSVISAFDLAKTTKKIIEERGQNAYKQNHLRECGLDLRNMIFTVIATTGVISGLSGGTGQLQIAHGFHNSLKKLFPKTMHNYLHGELVATGILVQMAYNGNTSEEISKVRHWMQNLSIPVWLDEYGIIVSESDLDIIIQDLCGFLSDGDTPENRKSFEMAISQVIKNDDVLCSLRRS